MGFCLGFPDRPPMQGLLARLVCRYAREAVRSAGFAKAREGRHPHRIAGDGPMSPGILWGCRACGAQRRVPGNSPAALERACGRWGSKGRRRGALPLAASVVLDPPRRFRLPLRWGHGRRLGNANVQGALPGRLAGWRVGDARDLTRSRGFAAAGFGGRQHYSASVVEAHVAARRLRGIVPLGIRPNGTIPLRGERPSSGSTRPFESSPGVFIMRKAVAAIRRRNMSVLKKDSAGALSHGLPGRDMDWAIPWDSRRRWNARNACWRFWPELD